MIHVADPISKILSPAYSLSELIATTLSVRAVVQTIFDLGLIKFLPIRIEEQSTTDPLMKIRLSI
jgi:hypothetical protein